MREKNAVTVWKEPSAKAGIHYQLDRPLRGLVQFLLAIVDGGDLPTVDQADHAFSAAAQVQNGAGQVFLEGQLHLCIPFDISIH